MTYLRLFATEQLDQQELAPDREVGIGGTGAAQLS